MQVGSMRLHFGGVPLTPSHHLFVLSLHHLCTRFRVHFVRPSGARLVQDTKHHCSQWNESMEQSDHAMLSLDNLCLIFCQVRAQQVTRGHFHDAMALANCPVPNNSVFLLDHVLHSSQMDLTMCNPNLLSSLVSTIGACD